MVVHYIVVRFISISQIEAILSSSNNHNSCNYLNVAQNSKWLAQKNQKSIKETLYVYVYVAEKLPNEGICSGLDE